jgi:type IX secretion system PorP/SprF family membrane protein
MKKYSFLFIAFTFIGGKVFAQDDVQLTQFYANKLYYNPAATGISDKLNASATYRAQWAGSPTLSRKARPNYILVNAAQYFADKRSGVGLTIYNASQHVNNNLQIKGTYAYHLQVQDEAWLAMGASLGLLHRSIKDGVTVGGYEYHEGSYTMSDLALGIEYYTPEISAGIAVQHIPVILGNKEMRQHTHWYYHASYIYEVDDEWRVIPSVFVRSSQGAVYNFDVSARVSYLNMFQLGLGLRKDAIAILAGFTFDDTFSFGYSFDIYTGQLNGARPSHEIVFSYKTQVLKKKDNNLERLKQTNDF